MLRIAPDVAARIGDEEAELWRTSDSRRHGHCWECNGPYDTTVDDVSLIVLAAAGVNFTNATGTHTTCRSSGTYTVAAAEDMTPASLDEVTVVTTLWPTVTEPDRPMMLASFATSLAVLEHGQRVDLVTTAFIGYGAHLIPRPGAALVPLAGPWAIHYRTGPTLTTGALAIIAGDGSMMADIDPFTVSAAWLEQVARTGRTGLMIGPLDLRTWTVDRYDYPAVTRAGRAGQLVGGTCPVLLTTSTR